MTELSLNILDLAQNSIKAGATLVEICVDESSAEDQMTVTITDNGCGMEESVLQQVSDPFYTTRTTRRVGLGLPFFRMQAEMTGGRFEISSRPGCGTVVAGFFVRSHIDCLPLGDMAATICTLVGCNPQMDFTYIHRMDGNEYRFSTQECREILEGIPLSSPEVLAWIRQEISENS